jgi:hypothetical protein
MLVITVQFIHPDDGELILPECVGVWLSESYKGQGYEVGQCTCYNGTDFFQTVWCQIPEYGTAMRMSNFYMVKIFDHVSSMLFATDGFCLNLILKF